MTIGHGWEWLALRIPEVTSRLVKPRGAGYPGLVTLAAARWVRMSAVLVTQVAPSRMSWWQPADWAEVTGPGTAITGRLSSRVCRAVISAPLASPASMTTVPADRAAMTRVRVRNRVRETCWPGGYSLTMVPRAAMVASRVACPRG